MTYLESWLADQVKKLQAQVNDLAAGGSSSGGGGSSGPSFLSGHGSPEGVVTGEIKGQTYLDEDSDGLFSFKGTVGANTGWV